MTIQQAGYVIQQGRQADKRAADLDAIALLVLATMWSFARRDPPWYCSASAASIARRSGLGVRTVERALPRLLAAGLCDWPVGEGKQQGITVARTLTPLEGSNEARRGSVREAEGSVREAEGSVTEADNRRSHLRKNGVDDDSARASGPGGPSLRGSDGASGSGRGGPSSDPAIAELAAEHAAKLGMTTDQAADWIAGKLAGRNPDNVAAYINRCVENYTPKTKGGGTKRTPPRKSAGKTTARKPARVVNPCYACGRELVTGDTVNALADGGLRYEQFHRRCAPKGSRP